MLTGAGISAESGVPTFRGSGGLWRQFQATVCFRRFIEEKKNRLFFFVSEKDLATPSAFARSPSLVWEFYHYRRELVRTKQPNQVRRFLLFENVFFH